ncbi:MAG: Acetyltransferase [Myxococcaceae bacterium]|nr:Acetyltransferase [Myxococcaceae bacterium]
MSQQPSNIAIEHAEGAGRGEFFVERDNIRLAEMMYSRTAVRQISIVHTEVDEQLRGHGMARRLLDTLVSWARETDTRVLATCRYAKAQFEKDVTIQDVYDGPLA